MPADYNVVDIVFITSALIIIGIASFRGLIKEVFSLINWATAFVASYLLSGVVAKIFSQYSTLNITIIQFIASSAIFFIVFLVMIFSTSGLAKEITSAFPPALNNFLGVVFGAFKTLLIFGLLYATYLTVSQIATGHKINANKTPAIISSAKTGSIIKYSGEVLQPVVYGFVGSIYNKQANLLQQEAKGTSEILNLLQNNYNLDEMQNQLNSQEGDVNLDSYQKNLQELQQKLNSNQDNSVPEPEPTQQPTQTDSIKQPMQEKGYKKQEILKKDYIIKINNN